MGRASQTCAFHRSILPREQRAVKAPSRTIMSSWPAKGAARPRSETSRRSGSIVRDGTKPMLAPALDSESPHVVGRALPVRLPRKAEQPVDRLRVAIDVVRVVLADPARMRLQIDDVDGLAARLCDPRQTRDGVGNAVVVLERRAADDQVEGPSLGEARDVEIPPDGIAELATPRSAHAIARARSRSASVPSAKRSSSSS